MNTAIQRNSSDCANGDARSVSTATSFVRRARRSAMTSCSAGTSKMSRRHSRVASSSIGNVGCFAASTEQVGAALTLLPERRALAGSLPRQQQRSRARLAEHAREHRRDGQGLDDRLLELLGLEQQILDRDALDRFGKPDHDAVVAPEHLGARAEPFLEPRLDRESPRSVHPVAEG